MQIEDFLLMRHEILLTMGILVILLADLFSPRGRECSFSGLAIGVMAVITLAGFLPVTSGTLFGGMYVSLPMNTMVKNFLNIGTFIVFLQAHSWMTGPLTRSRRSELYILLLSTLLGMYFMISAGDFLILYIGLELASIPIAAAAAYDKFRFDSAESGMKYILSSAVSSAILLYGISFIYGTVGTLYFDKMPGLLTGSPLQMLGFVLFFAGLAFKLSLVPFHLWTADVYQGAPTGVTSYLSVVSKGASAYVLLILLYTVFGHMSALWQPLLFVVAIMTMVIGNLFALRQQHMRRFIAFSSISQAGYILVGLAAGTQMGMSSVVYYILVYIFSNLGVFGVISAIEQATGKLKMKDYNGLYHTNPKLALLMTLALFSLAGIPPVAGFFGKYFLFAAAAQQGLYWLVAIAMVNTIISLYYYLLVVKAMFINKSEHPVPFFKSGCVTRTGLVMCASGIVVLGFIALVYQHLFDLSFGI